MQGKKAFSSLKQWNPMSVAVVRGSKMSVAMHLIPLGYKGKPSETQDK